MRASIGNCSKTQGDARMLDRIRADLRRYPGNGFQRIAVAAISQGFWAVTAYRIGHAIRSWPRPLNTIGKVAWLPLSKVIECATGIEIGHGAKIGPGLY